MKFPATIRSRFPQKHSRATNPSLAKFSPMRSAMRIFPRRIFPANALRNSPLCAVNLTKSKSSRESLCARNFSANTRSRFIISARKNRSILSLSPMSSNCGNASSFPKISSLPLRAISTAMRLRQRSKKNFPPRVFVPATPKNFPKISKNLLLNAHAHAKSKRPFPPSRPLSNSRFRTSVFAMNATASER